MSITLYNQHIAKIIKYLTHPIKKFKSNLNNYKEIINYEGNNEIMRCYSFFGNGIGGIRYDVKSGQIYSFQLGSEYRNQGLGKQILNKAINDMREQKLDE